jgi:hypothetical protein
MPGGVQVDHEHRVGARVRPAGQLGLEEHVVGVVERGHVPLDAVQHIGVAVGARCRLDGVDVGAGALLGDRVALAPPAADGRQDPAVQLLLGGHLRQPGRRRVDDPAKGVGGPADLLLHQHLLEGREAAAAQLFRHVDGLEAELADLPLLRLQHLGGQLAPVQLGLHLERQQLVDEGAGTLLDLAVGLRHRVGHGHALTPGAPGTLTDCSVYCSVRATRKPSLRGGHPSRL